jgi:hypothetical protein
METPEQEGTLPSEQRSQAVELTVAKLASEDAWRDIVRIKDDYRKDRNGNHIHRGTICKITGNGKSKWVIVHGRRPQDNTVEMDLNVRLALGVKVGETHPFVLEQLNWFRSLWFPWKASDPMYRLPAQLSIVSFLIGVLLGVLGILIGLLPFLEKHN